MTVTTILFRSALLGLFTLVAGSDAAGAKSECGDVHLDADRPVASILTDLQDAINTNLGPHGVNACIDGDGDLEVSMGEPVAFWIRRRADGTLAYFSVVLPKNGTTPGSRRLGQAEFDVALLPNGGAYVIYTVPNVNSAEEGLLHMWRFFRQVQRIVA